MNHENRFGATRGTAGHLGKATMSDHHGELERLREELISLQKQVDDLRAAESQRAGGMQLDEAIVSYIRKKYGLIIGTTTAEKVKLQLGTAVRQEEERSVEIQAQDQVSGLPRPLNLTNDDVMEALSGPLKSFVETARKVLEKTPPELVSDIIDRGVAICGGGALLPGIDRLMTKELGVPAYLVDNPLTCIAEGAAIALDANIYPKIQRNLPPV